jgi:hypothetical protein
MPHFLNFSGAYVVIHFMTYLSPSHNNGLLSTIQKFDCLKSSLKGEALQLIQSLELPNISFVVSWGFLRGGYKN